MPGLIESVMNYNVLANMVFVNVILLDLAQWHSQTE